MRYLIGFIALTLIGCAPGQPPQERHADTGGPADASFVGRWTNEDPSKINQPVTINVHPDGTIDGVGHDGDHGSGKWKAISKTSASFTDDDLIANGDTDVAYGELGSNDEMVITLAGGSPAKFKRQR